MAANQPSRGVQTETELISGMPTRADRLQRRVRRCAPVSLVKTDQLIRICAIAFLAIGCFVVLQPFVTASLLAAVFCLATWPLYRRLRALLRGSDSGAASLLTLLVVVLFVVPLALLAVSLVENFPKLASAIEGWVQSGPPSPPEWLKRLPWVGPWLDGYWHRLVESREELLKLLQRLIEPGRVLLVGAGKVVGQGVLQMVVAMFIGFFFYRDGEAIVRGVRDAMRRVAGAMSETVLETIEGTVRGVIFGIVGTALAQGVVAAIGFAIARVPAALALGGLVAVLSIVPAGPPIVWIGATVWLATEQRLGWALFMAIWGFVVISGIDNVVKPLLISRGSAMPLVLVLLGVFGGLVAFGFIGIFLGPVLLAVGYTLVRNWARGGSSPADSNDYSPL